MNSVEKFNALNGKIVNKEFLVKLMAQAFAEQQFKVQKRLSLLLSNHPNAQFFNLEISPLAVIEASAKELAGVQPFNPESLGIPYMSAAQEKSIIGTDLSGLGKAVSSNDIYEMVTNQIISSIEQNKDLVWYNGRDQKGKKDKSIFLPMPINFGNKKYYRGINSLILTLYPTGKEIDGKFVRETQPIDDERLFWLTLKQIKGAGGTLKNGSRSMAAVYYNWIFKDGDKSITETEYKNRRAVNKCSTKGANVEKCKNLLKIPFLKYFNVFNERDVEGIDFDAARKKLKTKAVKHESEVEKIEAAEAIIKSMPKCPIIVEKHIGKGESPNYRPTTDIVEMPQKEQYSNVAIWYGTAFHELTHATGHASRIGRVGINKFDGFGSPQYAFEELIAELGSAFLNSESGILFHTLKKNSAYIKGWKSKVVSILKDDNKAIFKAAGAAQKAADYILDRNAKGMPAYLKDFVTQEKGKVAAKKTLTTQELEAANPAPKAVKPKNVSLATAIEDILKFKKYKSIGKIPANLLYKHFNKLVDNMKFDSDGVSKVFIDLTSPFEIGNLSKASDCYIEYNDTIWLTKKGQELILSIKNRLESLQNQKHNYALFDGLAGKEFHKRIMQSAKKGYSAADLFILGNPTGELKKHLPLYPIILSGKVIKKSMAQTKDHNLNWANILELPDGFKNPQAIFKSKTKGIIVLTYLKDVNSKPVMVAIHIIEDQKSLNIASIYIRNNFNSYIDWIKEGLALYVDEKSKLFPYTQATIAVGGKNLLNDKDTKKTNIKKNNPKQLGVVMIPLMTQSIIPNNDPETPMVIHRVIQPTSEPRPEPIERPKIKRVENPYIQNVKHTKEIANKAEYFNLHGAFIDFTGRLEQKTDNSLVITLDAPPGAGKTRSVFQFLNIAANSGIPSIFASLEEHPTSKIFHDKRELYIEPKNEEYIDTIGELPPTYEEFMKLIEPYPVIAIDSWNKVFETYKGIDFDRDLRKAFNGKIIVTIFQRTGSGQMRGGSKAGFDGDVILEIVKADDYRDSYVVARKNRYQEIPLNEIGYNFFHQKVINPELLGANNGISIPSEIML